MLVLTRRQGESLRIGDDTKITVLVIGKTQIKLSINNSEDITTIRKLKSITIADDIKISVVKTDKTQVKLGIDAPANMKVDRV